MPLRRVGREHGDYAAHATVDPPGVIIGLEAGDHGPCNDHVRQGIGERAFQSISDFDPCLVLGGCYEQQHSIVFLRFADVPISEHNPPARE